MNPPEESIFYFKVQVIRLPIQALIYNFKADYPVSAPSVLNFTVYLLRLQKIPEKSLYKPHKVTVFIRDHYIYPQGRRMLLL